MTNLEVFEIAASLYGILIGIIIITNCIRWHREIMGLKVPPPPSPKPRRVCKGCEKEVSYIKYGEQLCEPCWFEVYPELKGKVFSPENFDLMKSAINSDRKSCDVLVMKMETPREKKIVGISRDGGKTWEEIKEYD